MFSDMKTNWETGIDMTKPVCSIAAVVILICILSLPVRGEQYFLYTPHVVPAEEKDHAKEGELLVGEVTIKKGDTLYGLSRKYSGHGTFYPQILLFNNIKNPDLILAGYTLKIPLQHGVVADAKTGAIQPVLPSPRQAGIAEPKTAVAPHRTTETKKTGETIRTRPASSTAELTLSDLKALGKNQSSQRGPKKRSDATVEKNVTNGQSQRPPANCIDPATIQPGTGAAVVNNSAKKPLPPAKNEAVVSKGTRDTFPAPAIASKVSTAQPPVADAFIEQKVFQRAVQSYRQNDFRAALELFERFLSDNPTSPLAADAILYKAECYMKLSTQ